MIKKIVSHSSVETSLLGESIGKKIKAGDLLALYGDLGSGKTTFTKGLAKGLGVKDRVISPTFITQRVYKISDGLTFYHIDLYRLEVVDENTKFELAELFSSKNNIIVIEWADKILDTLPKKRINIFFEYEDEEKRKILIK